MFTIGQLKKGINTTLADTANAIISCGTIAGYGWSEWNEIRACLNQWEEDGILRIINDPEKSPPEAGCVEMFRFFETRSPIPGFLNWEAD